MKTCICLLFILITYSFAATDIVSPNKGEQEMIRALRQSINQDPRFHQKSFVIGAGESGCKAFESPSKLTKARILLTWQWLNGLNNLQEGTFIVVPQHALDERFSALKDKFHIISIDGVLHTRTRETTLRSSPLEQSPEYILMLAGDVQQEDTTWKPFTAKMLEPVLKLLPEDRQVLILNGPRTGKHITTEDGSIVSLDTTAHRTTLDTVTAAAHQHAQQKPWTIIDFRYEETSAWGSALKYCLERNIPLILPGESTSMISECLSLGIKPIVYTHSAMTETSHRYITELEKQERIFLLSTGLSQATPFHQEPGADQIKVILDALAHITFSFE